MGDTEAAVLHGEGIGVQFGGLVALRDVGLSVRRGEILGIIGPNGAGKSTLINVISGIYRPSSGSLSFEGRNLIGMSPHQLVQMGIVRTFQNCRLFGELTVLDNVLIGMHAQMRSGLFDIVLRPGRADREMRNGVAEAERLLGVLGNDLLERRHAEARSLPHADRRRLEIARALAARPRLLLLDEPSAGMNEEETEELIGDIRLIQRERADLSIIVIEHDMHVIRRLPDRVIVLNYGEVIAQGRFVEVSRVEAVRVAYLGRRQRHVAS
ncbi:MAG: ABC transporter ATP-binding protein [Candidatus Dormibacteria bacterium]